MNYFKLCSLLWGSLPFSGFQFCVVDQNFPFARRPGYLGYHLRHLRAMTNHPASPRRHTKSRRILMMISQAKNISLLQKLREPNNFSMAKRFVAQ